MKAKAEDEVKAKAEDEVKTQAEDEDEERDSEAGENDLEAEDGARLAEDEEAAGRPSTYTSAKDLRRSSLPRTKFTRANINKIFNLRSARDPCSCECQSFLAFLFAKRVHAGYEGEALRSITKTYP